MPDAWTRDVLAFWLDELTAADWFTKNLELDERIKARFGPVYEQVASSFSLNEATADAERALAHIILLDQLPRNMFRGTARMFASDAMALATARSAVERGFDRGLGVPRRLFMYLPFEHSESMADQDRSVALFEELGDAEYLRFAIAHREIIARFGRFPHRNAVLGRRSTPEEIAFLQEPGSHF